MTKVSIVIPAYNEAGAIGEAVRRVQTSFGRSGHTFEVIVVDDGSRDRTADEAAAAGAYVIRHPVNIGYGNALLTGISQARYPIVGISDGDGTYPVEELPTMVDELVERGLDMLVGSRRGQQYHGTLAKRLARVVFKFLAEFTCGRSIPDINSGLRVMRRDLVMQAAGVLCGGFSFTTTLTVIAFLTSRFVDYRSIAYYKRVGTSHVRYFRDTLRSLQILLMTIVTFNPIKLYLLCTCMLAGTGLLAGLVCLILPSYSISVAVLSLFFLVGCLVMALGFLAEQHRAIQRQILHAPVLQMRREEPATDAGEGESLGPPARAA